MLAGGHRSTRGSGARPAVHGIEVSLDALGIPVGAVPPERLPVLADHCPSPRLGTPTRQARSRRCAGRCLRRVPRLRAPRSVCPSLAARALTRSGSCGSGVSSRVNPVSARTSRSRSACTTSERTPASGPGTPPRFSAKSSAGSSGGVAVKMSHSGVSRSGYSFWSPSPASAALACCSMAWKTSSLPLVQDLELG